MGRQRFKYSRELVATIRGNEMLHDQPPGRGVLLHGEILTLMAKWFPLARDQMLVHEWIQLPQAYRFFAGAPILRHRGLHERL
jgi:hypothetical protein